MPVELGTRMGSKRTESAHRARPHRLGPVAAGARDSKSSTRGGTSHSISLRCSTWTTMAGACDSLPNRAASKRWSANLYLRLTVGEHTSTVVLDRF